jgi:hypothetical protein
MKALLDDKLLKRLLLMSLLGSLLLISFLLISKETAFPIDGATTPVPGLHKIDTLEQEGEWHFLEWLNSRSFDTILEWQ